jgi:hypothetical protein
MRKHIFILLLIALSSCVKDKKDNIIPPLDVSNKSSSAIRLFNFYNGDVDVTVNNIPLTAYPDGNPGTPDQTTQIGLSLFPKGAWLAADNGSPFVVPNSLLDKNGRIHIVIQPRASTYINAVTTLDTVIENDVVHPRDYYFKADGNVEVLVRDNVPPADPQRYKLRIINLGGPVDEFNMVGPVTLTNADGTLVNSALSNVAPGVTSAYVELPYGANNFKVFISNGAGIDITRQMAEAANYPVFNPCVADVQLQEGIATQLRTFKPGGVYTIVVCPNLYTLFVCDKTSSMGHFCNTYRVLTESDPGVNYTYARMSAVNALPDEQATITIDGQPLGGQTLDYVGNTPQDVAYATQYGIFVQGQHSVKLLGAGGTELASENINLYPYDNYTIWAYEKPDGKPGLLFEANDMTGTVYTSPTAATYLPDDGTVGSKNRVTFKYSIETRFMNLCPDVPYTTFQNDAQPFGPLASVGFDTLRNPRAFTNIPSGSLPINVPPIIYIAGPFSNFATSGAISDQAYMPTLIRAFQSTPGKLGEVPGTLMEDVQPLNARKAYIANPALYTSESLMPAEEPGTYTVALVGNHSKGTAKLVLIKHNN